MKYITYTFNPSKGIYSPFSPWISAWFTLYLKNILSIKILFIVSNLNINFLGNILKTIKNNVNSVTQLILNPLHCTLHKRPFPT